MSFDCVEYLYVPWESGLTLILEHLRRLCLGSVAEKCWCNSSKNELKFVALLSAGNEGYGGPKQGLSISPFLEIKEFDRSDFCKVDTSSLRVSIDKIRGKDVLEIMI